MKLKGLVRIDTYPSLHAVCVSGTCYVDYADKTAECIDPARLYAVLRGEAEPGYTAFLVDTTDGHRHYFVYCGRVEGANLDVYKSFEEAYAAVRLPSGGYLRGVASPIEESILGLVPMFFLEPEDEAELREYAAMVFAATAKINEELAKMVQQAANKGVVGGSRRIVHY